MAEERQEKGAAGEDEDGQQHPNCKRAVGSCDLRPLVLTGTQEGSWGIARFGNVKLGPC